MKVTYTEHCSCNMCLDTFPNIPEDICRGCHSHRTHEAELISTGGGKHGDKAVVLYNNKFHTVRVEECTPIKES